jgi:hypothetical protein
MKMAKTATATRSLDTIADEFANISDTGSLRMDQCRLAYEWIGSTEGKEASERKESFRLAVNGRLNSRHEGELSKPAVGHLVDGWKYMLRANLTPTPDIAKAAHGLASQTFRKKEENYVNPAIAAILKGDDPIKAFNSAKERLRADKKEASEGKPNDGTSTDETISFDSIIASLGMLTAEFFAGLNPEEQSTLRDALSTASVVVA